MPRPDADTIDFNRDIARRTPLSAHAIRALTALGYAAAVLIYLGFCLWLSRTLTGRWRPGFDRLGSIPHVDDVLTWPAPAIDFPWLWVLIPWGVAITLWIPMHLARYQGTIAGMAVGLVGALFGPLPILAAGIIGGVLFQRLLYKTKRHPNLAVVVGMVPGVALTSVLALLESTESPGDLSGKDARLLLALVGAGPLAIGIVFVVLRMIMARREGTVLALLTVLIPAALMHGAVFENTVGLDTIDYLMARAGIVLFDPGPASPPSSTAARYRVHAETPTIGAAPWPAGLIDGRGDEPVGPAERQRRALVVRRIFEQRRKRVSEGLLSFVDRHPRSAMAPVALMEVIELQCRSLDTAALRHVGQVRIVRRLPEPDTVLYDGWRDLIDRLIDDYPASGSRCLADALVAEDRFRRGQFERVERLLPMLLDNCRKYLEPAGHKPLKRDIDYVLTRWRANLSYYDTRARRHADVARRRLLDLKDRLDAARDNPKPWTTWLEVVPPLTEESAHRTIEYLIGGPAGRHLKPRLLIALAAHPTMKRFREDTVTLVRGLRRVLDDAAPVDEPTVLEGQRLEAVRAILSPFPIPMAQRLLRLARRDARLIWEDGGEPVVELGHPKAPPAAEADLERLAWLLFVDARIAGLLPLADTVDVLASSTNGDSPPSQETANTITAEAAYELGRAYYERYVLTGEADSARRARDLFEEHLDMRPDSVHEYTISDHLHRLPRPTDAGSIGSTP
jgi:hypothetical protein